MLTFKTFSPSSHSIHHYKWSHMLSGLLQLYTAEVYQEKASG